MDKKMSLKVSNFHSYFASPPSDNKQDKQNKSLQSVYVHVVHSIREDVQLLQTRCRACVSQIGLHSPEKFKASGEQC